MKTTVELINDRLEELMDNVRPGKVRDAMAYSLLAGGKRFRPVLLMESLRAYGENPEAYLDAACAIEMVHTYSLIHDDLPAMDDDDLRRGRPTCHKAFDEGTAVLAGDALLNEAMNVIMRMDINAELKVKLASTLFDMSGMNGMIYGQQQDLYFEERQASLEELQDIHHYKTGCLIATPLVMTGHITGKDQDKLSQLGFDLGLAFQIQDDILDVTGNVEELGKNTGMDEARHKSTYVSLMGLDGAQAYCDELFRKVLGTIYGLQVNHGIMAGLVEQVYQRRK